MRTSFKLQFFFTVLSLLLVLLTVPMSTAETVRTVSELASVALLEGSPLEGPADTVFASVPDKMIPVDAFIHQTDSGSVSERPTNGYNLSFQETLLLGGFFLKKKPGRLPALLSYAGRIRCIDTVIAFNLGGNAPPFFQLVPTLHN